jgi:hypothetical protein
MFAACRLPNRNQHDLAVCAKRLFVGRHSGHSFDVSFHNHTTSCPIHRGNADHNVHRGHSVRRTIGCTQRDDDPE